MSVPYIASMDIENPVVLDETEIEKAVQVGLLVRVNFTNPGFSSQTLAQVDTLCERHGSLIHVGFFRFATQNFDPATLRRIPHVQSLFLNLIRDGRKLEVLRELNLRSLRLTQMFDLSSVRDFLNYPSLANLESLELAEVHDDRIDLQPLGKMKTLRTLAVDGHELGLASIAGLPLLDYVSLRSISRSTKLDFLSTLPRLTSLRLHLGSRSSLAEVSIPTLRSLDMYRVNTLGDPDFLRAFPNLEDLRMRAQGRLSSLDLSHCPKLESVFISSCGGLRRLIGIRKLESLLELSIGGTDLVFDELEEAGFLASLKVLRFYSKYHREDPALRLRLNEKGFFARRYCEYPRKT